MFVGVDGEGYNRCLDCNSVTGRDDTCQCGSKNIAHIYNMMGANNSDNDLRTSVVDNDGLRTVDCLKFLLDTKKAVGKRGILVGFAFNYDVNMMLKDVGEAKLLELWIEGETRWRGYTLRWTPSKSLYIKSRHDRSSVTVYDTFGFFQCRFVKALQGWDVPVPRNMAEMKDTRGEFTPQMNRDTLNYCLDECMSLSQMMSRLKDSLDSVNLDTRGKWHGAGAIAAGLLRREGIGDHVQPDETYGDLITPIMHAYFGGRTELFKQGEFDTLYGFDIRSAYPYATANLPSLDGASFRNKPEHIPTPEVISLHHVRWDTEPNAYIQPFPFRSKRQIIYPYRGEGYYWSCEVAAAQTIHGSNIQLLDAWVLETPNPGRPFDFVPAIYEERAKLKRAGHFGHQSYKLAINSLYGKLAQGVGWRGSVPPYRSYVWAGWITAYTRARMMQLASPDVVMICTDGIYFDRPQDLVEGPGLGELESSTYKQAFIAQPGIYTGVAEDGVIVRSRGVWAKEVDFDDLRQGYRDHGPYYVSRMETTRFVGLGTVTTLRSFNTWRRWERGRRKISLMPSRKFIHDDEERPVRHVAPVVELGTLSEPYDPKRSGMDAPGMLDWIQALEQPHRDIDDDGEVWWEDDTEAEDAWWETTLSKEGS